MKARLEIEQAPIRMMRSFYPVVEFEAEPTFDPNGREKPPRMNLEFDELSFAPEANNPNVFRVILGLTMQWPEETLPPYRKAHVLCIGDFSFVDGTPEEVRERHMYLSAPSMLFSGAREYVKLVTANGPFAPILLPGAIFKVVPVKEDEPAGSPAGQ
jgi:preprotein translocase subunit SecB